MKLNKRLNIHQFFGFAFAYLLLTAFSNLALANEIETSDLATIESIVMEKGQQYGQNRVLVVFDVDNTLLVTNQDLGSDQWFAWQSQLIHSGELEHAVAQTFAGLLEAQGKLYALSKTHKTQTNTARIVARIQAAGFPVMALTARGLAYRNATLRELRRNNISFKESGLGVNAGLPGSYIPYRLSSLPSSGLSPEEARLWKLKSARPVTYMDGVFMVAGQHKGAMLRTLLHKLKLEIDAVIFVDDKGKNTDHMEQGFQDQNIDLVSFRYSKEDSNVDQFTNGPKETVIQQWQELAEVITNIFG